MKIFKVMVFKGESDYGSPGKMILATWLILVHLNGNKFFLVMYHIMTFGSTPGCRYEEGAEEFLLPGDVAQDILDVFVVVLA